MLLSDCKFIVRVGTSLLEFDINNITELSAEKGRVSIGYLQGNARGAITVGIKDFEIREKESAKNEI